MESRDASWCEDLLQAEFGGRWHARRGELIDVLALDGFVADRDGERVGLLTYRLDEEGVEVAILYSRPRRAGVGTALIAELRRTFAGQRLWVVTTNDNLDAIRFYQRLGFALQTIRPGAIDVARRMLKPGIPAVGAYGIPLRDELELAFLPQ
jgi:ribosomal protein S18 acetylase RimI-like enzyme